MTDKSKDLNASVKLINNKLHFEGTAGDVGSAVLTFLRKMKKTITGCEINCKGIRREEHPTCFKTILLTINLKSADTTEDDLKKVIKLSEDTYCPVWAMLKGNVEVEVKYFMVS